MDPDRLQEALQQVLNRIPYFQVRFAKGLFWYHLEHNPLAPRVQPETGYPCRQFTPSGDGGYLFRVLHNRSRIIVEFCHALTDGTGGMTFLIALAAEYLRRIGVPVSRADMLALPGEEPHPEEAEDAYKRFYRPVPHPGRLSPAYHLAGTREKEGVYHFLTGTIPVHEIQRAARERNVTITELLVAVYFAVLQKMQRTQVEPARLRPIRLTVPINLRRLFPTRTMRNFSLYLVAEIDPRLGEYGFDEILALVHHSLRMQATPKSILRHISRHIEGERNPFIRAVPLFFKRAAMKVYYKRSVEDFYSGSLSNLGPVRLPEEMRRHVLDVEFLPCSNTINRSHCTVVSLADTLYMTFGRVIKETAQEELFFATLGDLGLPVRIWDSR